MDQTDTPASSHDEASADGYYDEDMGSEELDLSFLDEDEPAPKK